MKRILITGENSYLGTSFAQYMKSFSDTYQVDTVDLIGDAWRTQSFGGYDCVYHVAGIAHQKETEENADLYYKVNRDLPAEVARKAKADGVGHFIFLSSMSVYGKDTGVITKDTPPDPKSHYGRSKLEAEKLLCELRDENFRLCILRPPMVYGKGCKGNFNTVCKLVKKLPFFPYVKNERSMIYIDNLCSFVRMCVDRELEGVYFPQNREYVSTVDMARGIAAAFDKKFRPEYLSGMAVCVLRRVLPIAKKGFGTLVYRDTEDFDFSYIVKENAPSFIESAW